MAADDALQLLQVAALDEVIQHLQHAPRTAVERSPRGCDLSTAITRLADIGDCNRSGRKMPIARFDENLS